MLEKGSRKQHTSFHPIHTKNKKVKAAKVTWPESRPVSYFIIILFALPHVNYDASQCIGSFKLAQYNVFISYYNTMIYN